MTKCGMRIEHGHTRDREYVAGNCSLQFFLYYLVLKDELKEIQTHPLAFVHRTTKNKHKFYLEAKEKLNIHERERT